MQNIQSSLQIIQVCAVPASHYVTIGNPMMTNVAEYDMEKFGALVVLGLGSDSLMYVWHAVNNSWVPLNGTELVPLVRT